MLVPSAWTASVRHERTGSPSSWTVHAPAEYRLRVARVLVRRALRELAGADDGR
jgi:CO/xanthine dehydrogenase FAD-binding subunit